MSSKIRILQFTLKKFIPFHHSMITWSKWSLFFPLAAWYWKCKYAMRWAFSIWHRSFYFSFIFTNKYVFCRRDSLVVVAVAWFCHCFVGILFVALRIFRISRKRMLNEEKFCNKKFRWRKQHIMKEAKLGTLKNIELAYGIAFTCQTLNKGQL